MELSGQMILFAQVVESGSFSAAARQLDHTPSAISRQIAQLEDQLGVRLLTRSGRGIKVTQEGSRFYDRCRIVAQEVQQARSLVSGMSDHPTGLLRVVCTTAFGKSQILQILPRFLAANPDVELSIKLTDAVVDISDGDAEIAIQFSEQIEAQSAITRKIAQNRRILVAAPAYVERARMPQSFEDLASHHCLRLSTVTHWNDWIPSFAVSKIELNSTDGIYHAVLAGLGVARLSTYLVNEDIAQGRLLRVCPDYEQDDSQILMLFADRRNMPPKVRAFIDFVTAEFGPIPPWERANQRPRLAG